jgi:D-arabinose 1-dehydrogenase-like Zn-dependent alcohol dehydrogenase
VRELHLAGGELDHPASDPRKRPFRRDSHMDHLPEGVFTLLDAVLVACPRLEAIFFEHADGVLSRAADQARLREDFLRVRMRVAAARGNVPLDEDAATPAQAVVADRVIADRERPARAWTPLEDPSLAGYQRALLTALDEATSPQAVKAALLVDPALAAFREAIDAMEPRALEVGQSLVRLWGDRRAPRPAGQMRALTFVGAQRPLALEHVALPTPGPGEVRVRVFASGVCGTDVHMRQGSFRTPCPIVPGHEPVGVIDALGEGVSALRVGERVGVPWVQDGCGACAECARGALHRCQRPHTWLHGGGGHAEWMIVRARGCVRLPEGLAFEHAAPLFCAGFTVMSGLRRAARPGEGKRVAVLGVGGLGHLAIQIARAEGHEVVAVTQSASKRRAALELGASDVLVVAGDGGTELASLGGVDVILGTSNDLGATSRALTGLRAEGTLVAMGLPSRAPTELSLDPRRLLGRGLSVIGGKQGPREDLSELLAHAAAGRVTPIVETYPLTQAARAMQRLAEQRVRFRAVLMHGA